MKKIGIRAFNPIVVATNKDTSVKANSLNTSKTSTASSFKLTVHSSKEDKSKEVSDATQITNLLAGYINGNLSFKDLVTQLKPLGGLQSEGFKKLLDIKEMVSNILQNSNSLEALKQLQSEENSTSGDNELNKLINSLLDESKGATDNNVDVAQKIIQSFLKENSESNVLSKDFYMTNNEENVTQKMIVTNEISLLTDLGSKVDVLKKEIITLFEKTKVNNGDKPISTELPLVTLVNKTYSTNSSNNDETSGQNSGKDDKLLKELTSNETNLDKNDYQNKVTSFMTHFTLAKEVTTGKISDNLVVNKNTFASDIIKSVKYMELNNIKDLTVKISPKDLGELVIKVTMEQGNMKVDITASNKETFNMLNSNINDIKGGLNNQKIDIQNFGVNIYNGDTTFFRNGSNKDNQKQNNNSNSSAIGDLNFDDIEENEENIEGNVNILV